MLETAQFPHTGRSRWMMVDAAWVGVVGSIREAKGGKKMLSVNEAYDIRRRFSRV